MGTFHDDKGELHGITIVVDTAGPKVYVGRCDEMDDEKIVLMDADIHDARASGKPKDEYLQKAAKFGVWKKHDRLVVPRSEAVSIRRLGELPG